MIMAKEDVPQHITVVQPHANQQPQTHCHNQGISKWKPPAPDPPPSPPAVPIRY